MIRAGPAVSGAPALPGRHPAAWFGWRDPLGAGTVGCIDIDVARVMAGTLRDEGTVVMSDPDREVPTFAELLDSLSHLPPERARVILARARPAPPGPAPEYPTSQQPQFASWDDFLVRISLAERRRWCAQKAKKANSPRLMSGVPETIVTTDDVLTILEAARGRCAHCDSLAVEKRPSTPAGAPLPWAPIGRRIGSLGHRISPFAGGPNTTRNLVWSCLWCNTWSAERRHGATDHGGYFPSHR